MNQILFFSFPILLSIIDLLVLHKNFSTKKVEYGELLLLTTSSGREDTKTNTTKEIWGLSLPWIILPVHFSFVLFKFKKT